MKRKQLATLIVATVMLLAADGQGKRAVLMYASDVVVQPGASVALRVGVRADTDGRPVAGETVEYLLREVDGRELAEPVPIGAARSDGAGRATHVWNPSAGAWADVRRFDIVARLAAGSRYAAQARIEVFVASADRPLLLLKLDAETRKSSDRPTASPAKPAVSGSKVLEKLGGTYQFVYLSAVELRAAPAFKAWIERRRLPAGPLLLLEDDDAAQRSDEERAAKRIAELVQAHPRTAIGIGATAADARAFADNGLPAIVVPQDLEGVGKLPPDALATTNWTTVYAHARLCEMSEELLRTFEGGGAEAIEARTYLEKLGRPGVACLDRLRDEPQLRPAAIYVSGLLRGGIDGFGDALDWSTADALRDSLLAAWRFGEPSVVRRLYADPRAAGADPLPTYERWEALDDGRELDGSSVVYAIRLTAADGTSSVKDITCVRQLDSTWRVGGVTAPPD